MQKLTRTAIAALTAMWFAHPVLADADPKVLALIDQRNAELSQEAQKLEQLQDQSRQADQLNARLGDVTPDQQQQLQNIEQLQDQFQQEANQLADDAKALADRDSAPSVGELQEIDRRADALIDTFDKLAEASDKADDGNVPGAQGPDITDFVQAQQVIVSATAVSFAAIDGQFLGVVPGSPLGSAANRLNELSKNVDDLSNRGGGVDQGFGQQDFQRRDALNQGQEARQNEINQIEQNAAFDGSGGAVLAALVGRLGGDGGDGALSGDADAGARVQELAGALAGAGQRLSEINNEVADLDKQLADNTDVNNAAVNRAQEIDILLDGTDNLAEHIDALKGQHAEVRDLIAQGIFGAPGSDKVKEIEQKLADAEAKVPELEKQLEQARENDVDREALEQERDSLDREIEEAREKSLELEQRRRDLVAERDGIIGLQGELADLIRNGAPLGDADQAIADNGTANTTDDEDDDDGADVKEAANINLDRFLEGGSDGVTQDGEQVAEAGALPDAVEEAAGIDPLALDQFGFDADQGATEDITGFDPNNGGNNLFPCPPGSTALPPGTLVSDSAVCFI